MKMTGCVSDDIEKSLGQINRFLVVPNFDEGETADHFLRKPPLARFVLAAAPVFVPARIRTGMSSAMNNDITIDELIALGENGATVINAGKHAGSREIRGAVRYRPDDLLAASHLALPLATDRPVIVYDERGSGKHLEEIAAKLRTNGYPDVRTLNGGFAAYDRANQPTQEASTEQVVPPTKPQEIEALDRRM